MINVYFCVRHQLSDPSKPEFSYDGEKKSNGNEGITQYAHNSSEQQENFDPGNFLGETSSEPSYDCSQLAAEFVRSLNYDCNSPISSPNTSCAVSNKGLSEFDANAGPLIPNSQVVSGKRLLANESSMDGLCPTNQSRDAAGCDWESLISDAADLLNFDAQKDVDTLKKSLQPSIGFYTINIKNIQNMQTFDCIDQQGEGYDTENPSTQPGDGNCLTEFAETDEMIASSSLNNECMEGSLSQKTDTEVSMHPYTCC